MKIKFTLILLLTLLGITKIFSQNILIPFGSVWKYRDDGTDQGVLWRAPSFNDATWQSGGGKFGYGIDDATTPISYGPYVKPKHITTYFRKTISISSPSGYDSFLAKIKRDDGVVVYVNNQEVYRNNMPTGTITNTTLATLSASDNGTTPQEFVINTSAFINGVNTIAVEIHQQKTNTSDMVFDLELSSNGSVPTDQAPPTILSINRQSPATTTTNAGTVTFRATFSENVMGVTPDDFSISTTNGTASGTPMAATVTGTESTTYDISVSIAGEGTLRLDLKEAGTGITDLAGNAIAGGYASGESYTIQPTSTSWQGFTSVTNLVPLAISTNTAEKPQSKVWSYAGKYWTVLPTPEGTFLWRLEGTTWTKALQVSSGSLARADCKIVGNLAHILLFRGNNTSYLVSLEYLTASNTYQLWSTRAARVALTFALDAETATLDIDGTGRMWIAHDSPEGVNVQWSDSPYATWSNPIALVTGVTPDDICAIIALPALGKIGVLWSNQNTQRFGFKTHTDGASPTSWSTEEAPASQSALNIRNGMADDHLNMAVASNGTLYCAVKTSYDTPGYSKLALLIRRPTDTWDNLYEVTQFEGTRPIVILNESIGKLKVIYTSEENGGDILYKESPISTISFSPAITLINGLYNYVSSTKANYSSETVILATDVSTTPLKAIGFLAADAPPMSASLSTVPRFNQQVKYLSQEVQVYPNPFSSTATISFSLLQTGEFSLSLYNGKGEQVRLLKRGMATEGESNTVPINASNLPAGLYLLKLQTNQGSKTIRVFRQQ